MRLADRKSMYSTYLSPSEAGHVHSEMGRKKSRSVSQQLGTYNVCRVRAEERHFTVKMRIMYAIYIPEFRVE